MEPLVYDKGNSRVVAEDDSKNAFYTDDLTCKDEVIEEVIKQHNNGVSFNDIREYLLDAECSTEDMEIIGEGLLIYMNAHPSNRLK